MSSPEYNDHVFAWYRVILVYIKVNQCVKASKQRKLVWNFYIHTKRERKMIWKNASVTSFYKGLVYRDNMIRILNSRKCVRLKYSWVKRIIVFQIFLFLFFFFIIINYKSWKYSWLINTSNFFIYRFWTFNRTTTSLNKRCTSKSKSRVSECFYIDSYYAMVHVKWMQGLHIIFV